MTGGEEHVRRRAYRGFVLNLRNPKETHMPLDEFIINVYCEVCEAYAAVASMPLRRRGFAPALSACFESLDPVTYGVAQA